MELRDLAEPVLFATTLDDKLQSPAVLVFNPFAEGYIAHGKSFTPVKHQTMLARDLANLPQFLGRSDDIVLVAKRPSVEFLSALKDAGFPLPEFVELREGRIDPTSRLCRRKLGSALCPGNRRSPPRESTLQRRHRPPLLQGLECRLSQNRAHS